MTRAVRITKRVVDAVAPGAVDRESSGRGLGGVLLMDAIERATVAAKTVAMTVLVVDAIDETARRFYKAFGFRELGAPRRMFLTLAQ